MSSQLRTFFDHSQHTLWVRNVEAPLDVLAFHGEERLSQPFTYSVEFTCTQHDLAADQLLNQDARFSLHAAPQKLPYLGLPVPEVKPLRTLHGVITGFKRLSGSNDEARYEITLQPRLALLGRGKQFRIYQHQSVPEIVDKILRSRHDFRGQDFLFDLHREYPKREQVMQYGESDLAFIDRLLAEVGIWYRFTSDDRLRIDVVEFHDDQRRYQFDVKLPYRPPAGLSSSGQDGVWNLQTHHQVVEQHVNIRAYHPRDANAWLDGDIDQSRGAKTTYGEAYHYAEAYRVLGDALALDEDLQSESGYFYARLRHERYLNDQTRLSGVSSSATLAPGQVLKISGGAPQAFAPGAVITRLTTRAARDASFEARFEAMPYSENVCFRPPLPAKPQIAGTVPARVTSPQKNDPYAEIDLEGRYRVSFLFNRDQWPAGRESCWLRLARPYAGDTHGLHLPLIAGTEVAVAFEQGDPDRPYIAHALHDSRHPDHVTLRNYKRNVLRTPANNKLRMDDTRGQEHVKLSTEHSGKSQLNLGHLVDAQKQKRGEGFELRTDGWGAIRGGKGLFISADAQPKAQGQMLEMSAAMDRLQQAGEQLQTLSVDAQASQADPADVHAQLNLLRQELEQLKSSVLLLSAPQGIALTSGKHLQLAAHNNLMLNAGGEADISVVKRLFMGVGQGLSLFVRKLGIKLIANQGPVSVQAQNDKLEATKTVDIICWGFQPSMYFIRDSCVPCIGELLKIKAREGVEVRVLGWEFPFNAAGAAGEANLPGKGPLRIEDRVMQSSTQEQYAYDRQWFDTFAVVDNPTALLRGDPIPLYVSRGFNVYERAEIAHQVKYKSLDPQISSSTLITLSAAATHHQKTVLVDYEVPDRAVGFVMGHNMLDEYWDTDQHSALNRSPDTKPAPNCGPRGDTPRQDISCQVSGPILEHLHHNFATAWHKETGRNLLKSRQAMQVGPQLLCTPGVTRQLAQLVRTQPQAGKRDIEQLYLQAVNNATQFIYIENQYFRWPPLAELIKAVAAGQTKAGRDPGLHGDLHLFVITNDTDGGMGAGTVNTHRMLESLGRGDTIPEITKLWRIEQVKAQSAAVAPTLGELLEKQALITLTSLTDALGGTDISSKAKDAARDAEWRQAVLKDEIRKIERSTLAPEDIPDLKVHVCSLVAPDSPAGKPWVPVYIHSKLMIVDDVFTTHGSANINTRSMQVDSEMNIAHEWVSVTEVLRRRLWDLHTGGMGAQDDPAEAFDAWKEIIDENKKRRDDKKNGVPYAPLVEFYYGETTLKDLD